MKPLLIAVIWILLIMGAVHALSCQSKQTQQLNGPLMDKQTRVRKIPAYVDQHRDFTQRKAR